MSSMSSESASAGSGHRSNARQGDGDLGTDIGETGTSGDGHQHPRDARQGRPPRPRRASRLPRVHEGSGHLLLLAGEAGIGKTRLLHALQELAAAQGFALWAAGAFPQDVELSAGLLLDLGHAMSRSDRADVAARGQALVADLADVTDAVGRRPGDAHRRRRLARPRRRGAAGLADRRGPGAAGAGGPALVRRAEPGDRRAPGAPAALPAAARGRHAAHRRAPPERCRAVVAVPAAAAAAGRGGPALPAGPRADRADGRASCCRRTARRGAWSSWCTSARAACRCTSRSWSTPPRRATCPRTRRTCRRRWPRRSQQRFEALSPAGAGQRGRRGRRTPDLRPRPARGGRRLLGHEDAAASLDELVDRHFVHEESPGWFGFRHALIRDAIEANAPLARRRALHARVAEVARHRLELGGDAYRSAHHEAAGQLSEASEAAAAAADRASALSAHQEALDLLHRAVRCLRSGDDRRRVELLTRRAAEAAATDHNAQAAAGLRDGRGTSSSSAATLVAGGRPAPRAGRRPAPARRPAAGPHRAAGAGTRRRSTGRPSGEDDSGSGPPCWRRRPRRTWSTTVSTTRSRRASRPWRRPGGQDERTRLNTAATLGSVAGLRRPDATRAGASSSRPPAGPRELGLEAEAAAATG